ncbi:hypothetical protein L596_028117 [Steinernema carpocapsae]|uniref:Mitochondrial import receptor subunit TOM20 homolog n=1 Tax=Steinernema carpocapsae TaxID=34508 RepID=A0A4U5LXH3_STECR|nr:hypothetical protein L596_028117 [Steinernema carpocapsae]
MIENLVSTMMSFVRSNIGAIAGITGCAFVGYAVYFDRKRRSDPNYKQQIRENRRVKSKRGRGSSSKRMTRVPDVNNPTEMQAFFLQEVQLGEELIAEGQVEEGVKHLCNAIMMCGQPQQLLQIFQQTLPPQYFDLILQKMPETRERLARMFEVVPAGAAEKTQGIPISEGPFQIIKETGDRPPMVFMSGGSSPPPGLGALMDADDLE